MSARMAVDVLAVMEQASLHAMMRPASYTQKQMDEARAAVEELMEAISEDTGKPDSIRIDYALRKEGEPDGYAWWAFKRAELEASGYEFSYESSNGDETFTRSGYSARVTAALARCKGEG